MSERLYSLLLRLYPSAFRTRYADEMRRVFRERLRDERAVRVWLDVLADATVSIPRQHLQPRGPYPISGLSPASAGLMWTVHNMRGRLWMSLSATGFATVSVVPGNLGVALAFLSWTLSLWVRAVGRARAAEAYRVDVTDDTVTVACEEIDLAPVTVHLRDVTGVRISNRVGLRICTTDPARDLWVPSTAPSYTVIRNRLSARVPVILPRRHLTLRA